MSSVLGIDLSSKAVDLVKLDESSNQAMWRRVEMEGVTALGRLVSLSLRMPTPEFYEDIYLIAIEAPMSRGQPGTLAKLSRVYGAVVACIPRGIEVWEVSPVAWRKELGLAGNASKEEAAIAVDDLRGIGTPDWPQDALDAYAVAYYAREVNRRGTEAV